MAVAYIAPPYAADEQHYSTLLKQVNPLLLFFSSSLFFCLSFIYSSQSLSLSLLFSLFSSLILCRSSSTSSLLRSPLSLSVSLSNSVPFPRLLTAPAHCHAFILKKKPLHEVQPRGVSDVLRIPVLRIVGINWP